VWDVQPKSRQLHGNLSLVSSDERSGRYRQQPVTVLLTGLAGSGKSTVAYAVERRLFDAGHPAAVLDGQNLRMGISRDLGFTASERSENLRRGAEVARLINDAGLICLAAFVAPEDAVRLRARDVIGAERFLLVHLDTPVDVCRQRDESGVYQLADAGEIAEFPGVSAAYEAPQVADLVLPTDRLSVEQCVERFVALLIERGAVERL
jgi:bifunctional enzyme CysN/CysC